MSVLSSIRDSLRRLDLERFGELRPSYPPVAFEVDRGEIVAGEVAAPGTGRRRSA